jgi:CheY-like chemotaxis protein
MGGELHVRSELGKGSCFYFDAVFGLRAQEYPRTAPANGFSERPAPVDEMKAAPRESRKDEGARQTAKLESKPPGDRGRILIAEDSEDNRFLLQEYLKLEPYEIKFVENGQLAVETAKAQKFDLILMDAQMPVMDGLKAAKLIRDAEREEGRAPVPMVALTANARQEDMEASRAAGCNAHISKPISKGELLKKIKKSIQQYTSDPGVRGNPSPLAANVPPGLEEAAKRYLRSTKQELPQMLDFLQKRNFDRIRRLAHDIKGTATPYGFPDLTRIGGVMETAAKDEDASRLSEQLLELSRYLRDAERAFVADESRVG